jgi:hypothetical protein
MRFLGYSAFAIIAAAAGALHGCSKTETTCGDLGLSPAGNKYPNCAATTGGAAGKAGSSSTGGTAGIGGGGGRAGSAGTESGEGGTAAGTGGVSAGKGGTGGKAGSATGGKGGTSGGSSGAGGESGAGMGGSDPCNGTCKGPTPVCDADTDKCVECTNNSHCEGETPVCDKSTSTCVECTSTSSSHCQGATPACDTTTSQCVECTAANATKCTGEKPVCDTDANQCVACLTNTDCSSASAAHCKSDHSCASCMSDDDCTHLSGTHVCSSGTCVQCTTTNETACGANSCNQATHQCTTTPRGTVDTCKPCLADSECTGGNQTDPVQRCVPMKFQGTARPGGFCFGRASKTCTRPFTVTFTTASLSGADPEAYCGIDQDITRCEAVLDLIASRECLSGMDDDCGCTSRDSNLNCLDTGAGGLCKTLVGAMNPQCTYQCGSVNQCPTGFGCTGLGTMYCQ